MQNQLHVSANIQPSLDWIQKQNATMNISFVAL